MIASSFFTSEFVGIYDARSAGFRGEAWCFRLECTEGKHNKFWQCSGTGTSGDVLVRYGRIGGDGTTLIKDFDYAFDNASKKIRKGYECVGRLRSIVKKRAEEAKEAEECAKTVSFAASLKESEVVSVEVKVSPKRAETSLEELMRSRQRSSDW